MQLRYEMYLVCVKTLNPKKIKNLCNCEFEGALRAPIANYVHVDVDAEVSQSFQSISLSAAYCRLSLLKKSDSFHRPVTLRARLVGAVWSYSGFRRVPMTQYL